MFYVFLYCLQCSMSPYLGNAQNGGDATWRKRRGSTMHDGMARRTFQENGMAGLHGVIAVQRPPEPRGHSTQQIPRHTILKIKKRKEKTKRKHKRKDLSFTIDPLLLWLKISLLVSCNIPGTRYLVLYEVPTCFVDRHDKKTARSKGQAWRLNKSACHLANPTYIIFT